MYRFSCVRFFGFATPVYFFFFFKETAPPRALPSSPPRRSPDLLVDPDDASFILPPNMPAALADFCRRTGQPAPADPGAAVRCALESLALRYRWVLERLEERSEEHTPELQSQSNLVCRLLLDKKT